MSITQRNFKYEGIIDVYLPVSRQEDETCRCLMKNNPLICLGLNPSTANAQNADATIKRVEGYVKISGFDCIAMINLYPLRETRQDKLPFNKDEETYRRNIEIITESICSLNVSSILVATGEDVNKRRYLKGTLKEIIELDKTKEMKWLCIGKTKDGYPGHSYRAIAAYNPDKLLK